MAAFFKNLETGSILISDNATDAPAGYELLEANTVDAAKEKHVPVIDLQRDGNVIRAVVGEVSHPMSEEHHIEWIALDSGGRLEIHHLKPGQTPVTFFMGGTKTGTVYAYCNLHGLWSAKF